MLRLVRDSWERIVTDDEWTEAEQAEQERADTRERVHALDRDISDAWAGVVRALDALNTALDEARYDADFPHTPALCGWAMTSVWEPSPGAAGMVSLIRRAVSVWEQYTELALVVAGVDGVVARIHANTATCAQCEGPMPAHSSGGRQRLYCSDRCRQAAHRARKT
jgi:hypothetical protein